MGRAEIQSCKTYKGRYGQDRFVHDMEFDGDLNEYLVCYRRVETESHGVCTLKNFAYWAMTEVA